MVPTVVVRTRKTGSRVIINQSDFDSEKYEAWCDTPSAAAEPPVPKPAETRPARRLKK